MNNQFYIVKDGERQGPFDYSQLQQQGITRETYIWTPGMTDWKRAGELPELNAIFGLTSEEESAFGSYAVPEQQTPEPYKAPDPYNAQPQYVTDSTPHTNWMPWAIVATILGFLFSCIGSIFGIIGIVNASKANQLYRQGDEAGGKMNNSTARTMTIIGLALAGVGILLVATGATTRLAEMMLDYMQSVQ